MIKILTEKELRECVQLDMEVIEEIERGFMLLSTGQITMPPIMRLEIPENNGEVDVKSAYVHGLDSFAIKVSSGFFDNYKLNLPSLSGMMVLLSTKTGMPEAVLLDNGYLTDVRTGAAGAVAAKYLANESIRVAGVIGAGKQARYQIIGLKEVRDFEKLVIYSLLGVEDYVSEMTDLLGVEVIPVQNAIDVVKMSDVVVTTTPSKTPYLKSDWLHTGLHITAMGSDAEDKQELYSEVFLKANCLVCDSRSQSFRLGEYHHGLEDKTIRLEDQVIELGELVSKMKVGRRSADDITICDLTGTGMQDTIIASIAYKKASDLGMGLDIDS